MENTGYVGLSYQLALERRMEHIANNVANVDTSGYKASNMVFDEYLVRAKNQKDMSMVLDYGSYRNFQPGAIQNTGNPLDVALDGDGFLAVQTPDGEKYTRNGNLSINSTGQLVTSFGMPVVDASGKPISISPTAQNLQILEDGTISSDEGQFGRLKVVRFEDTQKLSPVGNTMYESASGSVPDPKTRVRQGMIEGSNVNAVTEMTNMIEVMRRYQSMAQLLQKNHDMELGMIQKLSRV